MELEERNCIKCSRSFKVLHTSTQKYCGKICQENHKPKQAVSENWKYLNRDQRKHMIDRIDESLEKEP